MTTLELTFAEIDELQSRVQAILKIRAAELETLDRLHAYWRGTQPLPLPTQGAPTEVRRLAQIARINLCSLAIDVPSQSLFVSGFRQKDTDAEEPVWMAWQANKLDARQTAVHRSTFGHGTAYVSVVRNGPKGFPLVRGHSARRCTALYEFDDDEWPVEALVVTPGARRTVWHYYDAEFVYTLAADHHDGVGHPNEPKPELIGQPVPHGMGVCPFVRFRNTEDLEHESISEIQAIAPLQDQLDETTFGLLVAQHYQAFRQRYILGWTTDDESEKAKAAASHLWTFDEDGKDIKVGDLEQASLDGYLKSREATLEHLAVVSQVPPHNLLGKMINLSADALAAAESAQRRKLDEREVTFGESWEQVLRLVAYVMGVPIAADAQVRWRDTEARSMAQTVDALGKMVKMLEIPPEEVWDRIPGVNQQDVDRWKEALIRSTPIRQMQDAIARHTEPAPDDAPTLWLPAAA